MLRAVCKLESVSPVKFSRPYRIVKEENETHDAHEERTWRERGHYNDKEIAYIPGTMFKKSLEEAARFLGEKIQGRGNKTYFDFFMGGILIENEQGIPIKVSKKKIIGDWVYVPSDGKRGGNRRVMKCFPSVAKWSGTLTVLILTDEINKEAFERHLKAAGLFIGVGMYRPIRGGDCGRFKVTSIKFSKVKN